LSRDEMTRDEKSPNLPTHTNVH